MDGFRQAGTARVVLLGVLIVGMIALGTPSSVRAGMLGTPELLAAAERGAQEAQVASFLARADVQRQLQDFGVAPQAAAERVAALTDAELQQLSATIGSEPAGGDILWVVGAVFVVLLILELVGVTDIFKQI